MFSTMKRKDHKYNVDREKEERRRLWMIQKEKERQHELLKKKKIEEFEKKRAEKLRLGRRSRSLSRSRSKSSDSETHEPHERYENIPEIKSEELTSDYIESFLKDIISNTAPKYGGINGFFAKLHRIWFQLLKLSLIQIWKGNPILTFLIFGLPSLIIFIMCKIGICGPEISEEEETEENENEETDHEKNE